MKKILIIGLSLLVAHLSLAMQIERLDQKVEIICYTSGIHEGTKILHKDHNHDQDQFSAFRSESTSQTGGATFEVSYIGFTEEARIAFQRAVDIWSSYLSSDVTIRVQANWRSFDEQGVLGSAIWGTAFRGFEGALNNDTWYPVALAEKMSGRVLNSPDDPDIVANFNRNANWYLGTDGQAGAGEHDLVTVVLHELGHGLGFVDSFNVDEDSGQGRFGIQGFPFTFDRRVENNEATSLVGLLNFPDSLGDALTSNAVFFNSPSAIANEGEKPRLFAPSEWSGGSSIAHLNESTYPAGDPNSLMSPFVGFGEVIQEPGQITLDMFGDMGWEYTFIENIDRPNSDDFNADNFPVTLSIRSEAGYLPETVTLFYSTDAFESDNNEVVMTATANNDEFTAIIPSAKTEDQVYSYYIAVTDVKSRTFNRPSLVAANRFLQFSTSRDSLAPEIIHAKPNFIRIEDATLSLEAFIFDYLPVNAQINFSINGGNTQSANLVLTDRFTSTYTAEIDLTSLNLNVGDVMRYSVSATDISNNSNNSVFPTTGEIELIASNTPQPIESFFSDFNDIATAANDFQFSPDFSVREENGFSNGALHSEHPYADGTGLNDQSNYTIELKAPILVRDVFPVISFDEIALIEPGDPGSVFGSDQFYDYVIVEASKDGGSTWIPLVDGYDSRANNSWASAYNGSINSDNNSEAAGSESLYVNRQINLLETGRIEAGDEILIRFRLFADQLAHGWGWAIDNLKVQIDDQGPSLIHNHLDFVSSLDDIEITARVTDNAAVDSVGLLVRVNGQEQEPISLSAGANDNYGTVLNISSLQAGDLIEYRLAAFDNNEPQANATFVPNETDFLQVPIISFNSPVDLYTNDFNTDTDDFVGNFYSITTPDGFQDGAMHSSHPYPIGFGVIGSGSFIYTLKTPIRIDEEKALAIYDEIVLVDPVLDFTALEASKDNGETWFQIVRYGVNDFPDVWAPVFENGGSGNPSMFRKRMIELTQSPEINDGDVVLLRFRLERRGTATGWGWAIDNLEIQTQIIASIENQPEVSNKVSIYPNPIQNGLLNIQLTNVTQRTVDYDIITMDGNQQSSGENLMLDNENKASINVSGLPAGLFFLRVVHGEKTEVFKVLKLD